MRDPRATARAIGGASWLAIAFGVIFLVDCRVHGGKVDSCYLTGGALAGLGTAGRAGYETGFWTPNPALNQARRRTRREEDDPAE